MSVVTGGQGFSAQNEMEVGMKEWERVSLNYLQEEKIVQQQLAIVGQ